MILVSPDKEDFITRLPRLRDKGVQFLYLPVDAVDVIKIAKEVQKLGWSPTMMGGDNLLINALSQTEIDAAHHLENFFTTSLYSNNIEVTEFGRKATEVFRSLFKTRASVYPAAGFEGMSILQHGMNRCQNPANTDCINYMLHNETIDFEGIMGKITILQGGKAERPLIINRIRKNRLEFVVKVY